MTSPQTGASDEILLVSVEGGFGHATLNRPRQLNALSVELIDQLAARLRAWAVDDTIAAVLVTGAGDRGLCAGGDIKQLYAGVKSGDGPGDFFEHEYAMNLLIAQYPKPYVVVMDGITMGGGVGISVHGSVRVVTERTLVAMPETGIGLFPDVGALYCLARCPGEFGTHLALTGARMDGPTAIAAGFADHFLPSDRAPELVAALTAGGASALQSFAWPETPVAQPTPAWIDECYSGNDVTEIVARLASHPHPDAVAAATLIGTLSPTSLTVTLAALRRAATMDIAAVLAQDLVLTGHFVNVPDLVEGIRAQLIDKDRTPRWDPPTLADVDPDTVAAFFA